MRKQPSRICIDSKMKLRHRKIYEDYYGKITDDECIIFLDGNIKNLSIDNLYKVDKKVCCILNANKLLTNDKNLTLTAINIAKLILKTNSVSCVPSRESLYNTWQQMRNRCNNPNNKDFKWYGAKGIKVCEDWENFCGFQLWALQNNYRKGLIIHRLDENADYSPENCKFISRAEQNNYKKYTVL